MWIGVEIGFFLKSVCCFVYVLFYLGLNIKGLVGINKGKKMEYFSLEKIYVNFLCFLVFFI